MIALRVRLFVLGFAPVAATRRAAQHRPDSVTAGGTPAAAHQIGAGTTLAVPGGAELAWLGQRQADRTGAEQARGHRPERLGDPRTKLHQSQDIALQLDPLGDFRQE